MLFLEAKLVRSDRLPSLPIREAQETGCILRAVMIALSKRGSTSVLHRNCNPQFHPSDSRLSSASMPFSAEFRCRAPSTTELIDGHVDRPVRKRLFSAPPDFRHPGISRITEPSMIAVWCYLPQKRLSAPPPSLIMQIISRIFLVSDTLVTIKVLWGLKR